MIKKLLYVVLLLALIVPALLPQVAMAQTTIDDTVLLPYAEVHPWVRQSAFAAGLQWTFYKDADGIIKYKTSSNNGASWSSATNVYATTYGFSIAFEGTVSGSNIHLVYYSGSRLYRRGVFYGDGTIIWGESSSFSVGTGVSLSVAVDSNDYPWIGVATSGTGLSYCNIIKSSTKDGTFTEASGFPLELAYCTFGGAAVVGFTIPMPLTSGRMAIIYGCGMNSGTAMSMYARRWNGTAWSTAVDSTLDVQFDYISAVSDGGDDVHIVFLEKTTYDIEYIKYSYSTNAFSGQITLYSGATSTSAPVITRDTTNNDLWVWYENDPTDDHLYMAKYVSSEATWYTEYDLLDEVDDLPANGYYLNSHYTAPRDNIGLFYIAGTAILKFKSISEQFDVDTLEPSGVTETQATLRGEIISIGWGTPHERGFYWDTTPSLGNTTGTLQLWYETGSFSTGVFTHTASDLAEGQSYYYIAYATNAETVYGEWVETTAGGTEGWCVVTLEPDPVGDFEATFRGNITEVAGTYAEIHGFQWGHTATATWEWTDTGQFTIGIYTYEAELEADSIYYVRAFAGNSTTVDYGQWIGFITDQPSYIDDPTEGSNILPAAPDEPGGWIKPPRDWGTALGIPWTFILYVVLSSLVVIIGIGLSAVQARTISVLFIVFGFILGWFSFWPRGGYLDWWIMLPYILVGWALMNREKESPLT